MINKNDKLYKASSRSENNNKGKNG